MLLYSRLIQEWIRNCVHNFLQALCWRPLSFFSFFIFIPWLFFFFFCLPATPLIPVRVQGCSRSVHCSVLTYSAAIAALSLCEFRCPHGTRTSEPRLSAPTGLYYVTSSSSCYLIHARTLNHHQNSRTNAFCVQAVQALKIKFKKSCTTVFKLGNVRWVYITTLLPWLSWSRVRADAP